MWYWSGLCSLETQNVTHLFVLRRMKSRSVQRMPLSVQQNRETNSMCKTNAILASQCGFGRSSGSTHSSWLIVFKYFNKSRSYLALRSYCMLHSYFIKLYVMLQLYLTSMFVMFTKLVFGTDIKILSVQVIVVSVLATRFVFLVWTQDSVSHATDGRTIYLRNFSFSSFHKYHKYYHLV